MGAVPNNPEASFAPFGRALDSLNARQQFVQASSMPVFFNRRSVVPFAIAEERDAADRLFAASRKLASLANRTILSLPENMEEKHTDADRQFMRTLHAHSNDVRSIFSELVIPVSIEKARAMVWQNAAFSDQVEHETVRWVKRQHHEISDLIHARVNMAAVPFCMMPGQIYAAEVPSSSNDDYLSGFDEDASSLVSVHDRPLSPIIEETQQDLQEF